MSIEALVIKQAQLSDLRRDLKEKGCKEAESCERLTRTNLYGQVFTSGDSCIARAYADFQSELRDSDEDSVSFEEIWNDLLATDAICAHCQNVRELKRKRMAAGRALGSVRGALTRVGRKLAQEPQS